MDDNKISNIKTPQTSGTNLIQLKGIEKGFKINDHSFNILKGVDLDIGSGDTIAIVGTSGIGKSTLLHIIGTLDRPEKGRYLFKNKDIYKYKEKKLAEFRNSSIGFVFQFHHLLPEFSALENVMMPKLINRINKEEAKESAEEMLVKVGLKERLLHRTGELSGGEQQRVAIARAIVQKPSILLADEPTGNLDIKTSDKIHELLLDLNRDLNMTMVVVTHNLTLASYMSREMTLIEGKLKETV